MRYERFALDGRLWFFAFAFFVTTMVPVVWPGTPTSEIAQLKQQLALVQAGRDFSERVAAQVVTELEAQLVQKTVELETCHMPALAEKETTP